MPTAKAMTEGRAAYYRGDRPTDNPYLGKERRDALAWSRGFNQARTEQRRANMAVSQGIVAGR